MTLHDALAGMRAIPQWFLWRLQWDSAEQKYQKTPCALDGSVFRIDASQPSNWRTYEVASKARHALDPGQGELRYALGFWLTEDSGYWFYDLDKCASDGVLNERAAQIAAAFPGAFMEWSSSGRGIHIIGKCGLPLPPHRSRDVLGWNMEFYHRDRGIAFGINGQAQGSADTNHDAVVAQVLASYFPPRAQTTNATQGPRAEWRGPADDDELIRRMLASKPSAAVAFGGKASVQQLWAGEVEKTSEHDMALAAHLAFWTGCDEERMVRLMLRSGLKREKWQEHRTYLRDLTVRNAIAGCSQVYQEPVRDNSATKTALYGPVPTPTTIMAPQPQRAITEEQSSRYKELLSLISGCGSVEDMHNDVIPAIAASNMPAALVGPLAAAINSHMKVIAGEKIPIGQLRRLLSPPVVAGSDAPLWVLRHCYVKDNDKFFDTETGATMTLQGFQAEYTRVMPLKENGQRENPVDWALNRWGMRTVQRTGYRPDKGTYYEWDGLEYANLYNANSVPPATPYTDAGVAGIRQFHTHLYDMCGRRSDVFAQLLSWLAWNVQNPGKKIRWAPIIKGINGDGKTLLSNVMRAAMGYRNVSVTGNSTLTASGGFTDWAVRGALNFIEEIMLVGKARHQLYNAMKEYITNDIVNINPKGAVTRMEFNVTNHFALTNHNDALPLEETDRRWMVIFTPWFDLSDMMRYCGIDENGWRDRTGAIDFAWKNCAGELRAWFLSLPIDPAFDANGSAPVTAEKSKMMATSRDDIESLALQIIEEGALGVHKTVFVSSALSNMLRMKAANDNLDVPRTSNLAHMFTRLGYSKFPKAVKWRGQAQTIWVKNGFTDNLEIIRANLDATQPK